MFCFDGAEMQPRAKICPSSRDVGVGRSQGRRLFPHGLLPCRESYDFASLEIKHFVEPSTASDMLPSGCGWEQAGPISIPVVNQISELVWKSKDRAQPTVYTDCRKYNRCSRALRKTWCMK